jgi:hypothetical protein
MPEIPPACPACGHPSVEDGDTLTCCARCGLVVCRDCLRPLTIAAVLCGVPRCGACRLARVPHLAGVSGRDE